MSDLGTRWSRLSAAWKAFFIAFAVLMILLGLLGFWAAPLWWVLTAAIWAGAFAGIVRLIDRARNPPWR